MLHSLREITVSDDKIVTAAEFIPAWGAVTSMSQELSTAYFYLADIDDSGQITSTDLSLVYQRFDIDGEIRSVYKMTVI